MPDEVCQRLWHSVAMYTLSPECVLMVVFGGRTALLKPSIADTYVVELGERVRLYVEHCAFVCVHLCVQIYVHVFVCVCN